MRIRKKLFLICLLFWPILLFAQDDTALWTVMSVKKPIGSKWITQLRSEIHSRNNTSEIDYWYILGGGGYKFNNWLRTDFGGIYIKYNSPGSHGNYQRPIYRTFLSFTAYKKLGSLRGSLREYWSYCFMPETTAYGEYKKGSAYHEVRTRLRLEYMSKSKLTPYAYIEEWQTEDWERIRYCAGTDYKLDKHTTLGAFYMWQDKHFSVDTHVLGLELSYTL